MISRLSHENGSSDTLFLTRLTSHTASTTYYVSNSNIKFPQLKVQTARLIPNTLQLPFFLHVRFFFSKFTYTSTGRHFHTNTLVTHIVSRCNIDILFSGLSEVRLFWSRTNNHPNSQLLFKTNSPFWVKPANKRSPPTLSYALTSSNLKRKSSVELTRVRTAPTSD
jgi:hypothetical protein